jgi:hypothetical protein
VTDRAVPPARRGRGCLGWAALIGLIGCGLMGLALAGLAAYDRLLPPSSPDALRSDLVASVEEARTTWLALDDLWGHLEAGEAIYCSQTVVTRPYFAAWRSVDRAAYPELAGLADELNLAISGLHHAADTWTTVCQGGKVEVAAAVVGEARAALDRAGARLDTLLAMLDGSLPDGE